MDKNVCLFRNGLLGMPPLKTKYLFVPRHPFAEDTEGLKPRIVEGKSEPPFYGFGPGKKTP